MKKAVAIVLLLTNLCMTGCYVHHPPYCGVHQVMNLKPGMSLQAVDSLLAMKPYDILSSNENGLKTFIYKYRVQDVKRIPILMKKNRGIQTEGRLKDILITVNQENIVTHIESREEQRSSIDKQTKVNPNTLITALTTLVTVTIPAVLVFLSLDGK